MNSITKIAEEAANQVVAATSAKKKKKKGMPSWLLAPAGLGAAAGLGGAYALGSDQHAKDIEQAIGQHGTPLEPNETYLSRYANMLSPGANTKIMGKPIGDLLALGRSSPTILKAFGADPTYAASNPGSWHDAKAHYSMFAQGPISAYAHMMHPNKMMNRAEYNVDIGDGKKVPYADLMNKKFQEHWDKFRDPTSGYAGLKGNGRWLEPHDVNTDMIPYADQVKFLKDFHAGLPPELRKIKERVENDPTVKDLGNGEKWKGTQPALEDNLKNYIPITRGALKARNIMKNVGITSAGAGAGGLLGHYLHGALADEENPSTLGYMASTLGGAGLGGAASYFGGTEQGRQQASNLIGKLMSMMQKKSNVGDKSGAPAPAVPPAKPAPQSTSQPAPTAAPAAAPAPEPQQGNWLSRLPTSQALVPLGGAALGGVLGNMMGGSDDEDEEPNTFKKLLYTLGGVGLGGAAGYFGGTSQGRETMSNAYNSLFGKKQAAANKLNSLLSKKAAAKPGLWANIHAKKERGAAPAKPGDKAYPDAKNWKKVTEESEKKAGLFYKNLDEPIATVLGDESGEGLASMRTQAPRLLTKLLSNPTTDAQAVLSHLAKHKPESLRPAQRPEDHVSNDYGAALQQLFPSRYRDPRADELFATLGTRLSSEKRPRYKQDVEAMQKNFAPMAHQRYSSPDDKTIVNDLFDRLKEHYPDRKTKTKVTQESEKSSSLNQVPENLQELALRTALYSLGGAGVGGIAGAIFPEEYEEKNKKGKKVVKTMGRLESALRAAQRGGLTLGAVGLGGGALRMALDKSAQVSRQNTEKQAAPAWQTSEGKSESGGLNDKGRASLKAQGHDIKRPQPEGGPRKDSFCARMKGMKAKLTSDETANDPDSRINKSLRKWKCGSAQEKWAALAALALASNAPTLGSVFKGPKDEKGHGIKFQFGTASNPSFLR